MQRLRSYVRRFLRWLIRLRGSPQAIAGGIALGVFVAFTPTIGFQMILAVGLATVLNVSRPAAIVPTWLTNPVTIPPVYAFTYYLGSFFWSGPDMPAVADSIRTAARELASLDLLSLRAQLDTFVGLGIDVFVPMWIGGILVGASAAAVAYPVTYHAVIELRRRRAARGPGRKRKRSIRARTQTPRRQA